MRHIHRAWLVCLGCMILLFCCTGLAANCFTIYLPFIMEKNSFTNTQTSMIITIRCISSLCSMLLAGVYYRHISIRRGMVLACLSAGFGFFVYGMARSWVMYLAGALLVGIGYGLASTIPIGILLNRWFAKSLTFATGICTSVTGLATHGIPSLITWCVGRFGLGKTLSVEGLVIALLGLLSLLLLVDYPVDKACKPYGDGEAEQNTEEKSSSDKSGQKSYHPFLTRRNRLLLMPVIMLTGTFCSVSYGHLSVFMTTNGM